MNQNQASSKAPRPNKTQEQLARNSVFWWSPVRRFSFVEVLTEFVAINQNVRAKRNVRGPGFEIKIAACAKIDMN